MKKMFFALMMLMACTTTFAQTSNEDFFLGKWKLMVEGLPTGDTEMLLVVMKDNEGKLGGGFGRMDGSEFTELTKVEIKDKTLQVNFEGGGYNVSMYLDRKDDGTVAGSMMDMFDCTGTKIKEKEKE